MMAMGKERTVVVAMTFLLIAGILAIESVGANPYPRVDYTGDPVISIQSPTNLTTSPRSVNVTFTVEKALQLWLDNVTFWNSSTPISNTLSTVTLLVDGEVFKELPINDSLSSPYNYTEYLTNLKDGNHFLRIEANCQGWYVVGTGVKIVAISYPSLSDSIYFTVDSTPPLFSNVFIENKTYNQSTLPLSFNVNKPTSWIGYCLDTEENVTVIGNTTLAGLTEGSHSFVIYANDTVGNMGMSETVFFTVSLPTPTPSPTQRPTPSLSPTPTTVQIFPPELILVTVLAVLVGIAGLILWLGKR